MLGRPFFVACKEFGGCFCGPPLDRKSENWWVSLLSLFRSHISTCPFRSLGRVDTFWGSRGCEEAPVIRAPSRFFSILFASGL